MSHLTLRGLSGLFRPNPSARREQKERENYILRSSLLRRRKRRPSRARDGSQARSRPMPTAPAPKSDPPVGMPVPPSPLPPAQKPLKERERKNKKDMVPDGRR